MNAPLLLNRTFDELNVGDSASLTRVVRNEDIELFAAVSGDVNPAHLDKAYAATDIFGHVVIHGMWTGGLISTLLGTELPGPGTIYLSQDLHFRKPVAPGDTITATVTVLEKKPEKRIVLLDTRCVNQTGVDVLTGTATVIAPSEKLALPRIAVPEVLLRGGERYSEFVQRARSLPPMRVGVVHPCSVEAL
ncbi:MAG: enoyl-CoA hydratase, partial [Azorhizobium sp. 12-66-6]